MLAEVRGVDAAASERVRLPDHQHEDAEHADNPAQAFYRRNGFQHLPHCLTYVLAGPALETLAGQNDRELPFAG
jgi:hypothetical protein